MNTKINAKCLKCGTIREVIWSEGDGEIIKAYCKKCGHNYISHAIIYAKIESICEE